MQPFQVVPGARVGRRTANPLLAPLTAAWEAEELQARALVHLADHQPALAEAQRVRLRVQAAFSRAHASRLWARLVLLTGSEPRVLAPYLDAAGRPTLASVAAVAAALRNRYGRLTEQARALEDGSTSWVCQLNRDEAADQEVELRRLQGTPTTA